MSTREFFSVLADWLLHEPIYQSILIVLSVLQLGLWFYMISAHHLVKARLLSVELRHIALMERTRANDGEISKVRRNTLDRIDELETQQTTRKKKGAKVRSS